MERSEIVQQARDLAENFHLHLGVVQWRQKKSFLSARLQGQELYLIFHNKSPQWDSKFHYALLFVILSRLTHQTNHPKYLYFKQYIKENPPEYNIEKYNYNLKKPNPLLNPTGKVYNLIQISEKVLLDYVYLFKSYFQEYPVKIGWTTKSTYRRMAYYQPKSHIIAVSKSLDTEEVPLYVIEYLLFHEFLHAFLGHKKSHGKRQVHHSEFHKYEKNFVELERANQFLSHYCQTLRQNNKRIIQRK